MRPLATLSRIVALAFTFVLASGVARAETKTVWDTFDNASTSTQGLDVGFVPFTDSDLSISVRFVPSASGYLRDITVPFVGPATDTADVYFELLRDSDGYPGQSVGYISGATLAAGAVTTITGISSGPNYVIAGQAYWIKANGDNGSNVKWRSITSGTGTWYEHSGVSDNQTKTDNRAPALEVRVDSDFVFDFNQPAGSCYFEEPVCNNPEFERYYDWGPLELSSVRVVTSSSFGGATPQQDTASGVLQMVRPLESPDTAAVQMAITSNAESAPGVKRFRFTLSNRNTSAVTVTAQLSGQIEFIPGQFIRTIPAGATQTLCFNKSALDAPNAVYTGVEIEAGNVGPVPLVTWDNLYVDPVGIGADPPCSAPTSLDNDPTPVGTNVPVVRLDQFLMTAAEVVQPGYTSTDICIAPDPREVKSGSTWRYTARVLRLSELANKGTCKGVTSDGGTWPALLNATGLEVAPWFRTFIGVAKIGGAGVLNVEAPWVVVAIIRTSAEYKGAVGVAPLAERLITYSAAQMSSKNELQCDTTRDKRPLSLGGTVASFGDFMNVEDERMILETGQCDGGIGLTRRTTHVFPMRIDTALYSERSNAMTMLDGIGRTLQRATCADPSLISTLNGYLTAARAGVTQGTNAGYTTAVARLHDFAIAANNGGIAGQFSGCLVAANYQGTFVVRAINSAFTVFDRLLHPLPNAVPTTPLPSGSAWEYYYPPSSINLPLTVQPTGPGM